MRKLLPFLVLASALGTSSLAFADTYQYEYQVNIPGFWVADVVVDSSVLISSPTSFAPSTFVSCTSNIGGCAQDLNFLTTVEPAGSGSIQNGFEGTVPLSAIENVGIFTNGAESLSVTELAPAAATPEPSGIALLGTGILSLAGVARRRFIKS